LSPLMMREGQNCAIRCSIQYETPANSPCGHICDARCQRDDSLDMVGLLVGASSSLGLLLLSVTACKGQSCLLLGSYDHDPLALGSTRFMHRVEYGRRMIMDQGQEPKTNPQEPQQGQRYSKTHAQVEGDRHGGFSHLCNQHFQQHRPRCMPWPSSSALLVLL
jgi:hypothetical protein